MTRNSGWALGISVAAVLALVTTNPDSVRLKEQLVSLLRDRLDTMGESGGEGARLLGAFVSSYAPDAINEMIDIKRTDYFLFSHFIVTPKGLLGVSLELADKKALARDGLCVVGIAGTFFPCNTHASEWLAAPAEAR
jgi:hypothetical protein